MRSTTRSPHSCPAQQSVVFPGAPAGIFIPPIRASRARWRPPAIAILRRASAWPTRPAFRVTACSRKYWAALARPASAPATECFTPPSRRSRIGVMSANAPYGTTYTSPAPPLFATPFVTAATGQNLGQAFPVTLAPLNSSASHPDPNIDWSQFEPITGLPNYPTTNRIPYTEEYMLSLERGLGANTVLSVNYVGTQGHRLLVLEEANPGDPVALLVLEQSRESRARTNSLRPFRRRHAPTPLRRDRSITAREVRWDRTSAATPTRPPSATPITTPCRSPCATPANA